MRWPCLLCYFTCTMVQHIHHQLLSTAPLPWQQPSSPPLKEAKRVYCKYSWTFLTWPPGPTQESKGEWESCSGAYSGQTFHTFAGWTRAEMTKLKTTPCHLLSDTQIYLMPPSKLYCSLYRALCNGVPKKEPSCVFGGWFVHKVRVFANNHHSL